MNVRKNALFFSEFQVVTVFLLTRNSYMRWRTSFVSVKVCMEFPVFNSISFLLEFIFLFNKKHGLFDFETS